MKKNLFILVLSLITGFAFVLPLAGYTISGKVLYTNPTRVTLSGDASLTVVTDSSGVFQFSGLAAGGSYTITPSRLNYPTFIKPVNPLPNSTVSGIVPVSVTCQTDFCGFEYRPSQLTFTALDGDKIDQNFQPVATACCFQIISVKFSVDDSPFYLNTTSTMACSGVTYSSDWKSSDWFDGQHILKIEMVDNSSGSLVRKLEIPVMVKNNRLRGDVNYDGIVNIVDALLVAQYSAGLHPIGFTLDVADVDCNSQVDILDALKIARFSVGLINWTVEGCLR